jgi:hypothetical protein
MNAPNHSEQTALVAAELPATTNTAALILQGDAMDRIERFAKMMSTGKLAVPRHFNGAPADCFAVCLQAMQWRMNPFAVAQKTFVAPSGALGYEGTLVAAALSTSGALEGDLRYEYIGDWSKVRGKFEKRESQNRGNNSTEPKFYIVPTYTKADEEGLGVRAIGRLRGERADRIVELFLSQCYPRFSTQWANNPEQQIVYAVDRVWARRHKPSVMLGVYTEDELAEPSEPKFMGPADVVGAAPAPKPAPTEWPADLFAERLPEWHKAIKDKKATPDAIVAKAKTKYPLSAQQEKSIRTPAKPDATDATPKGDPFTAPTYAEVADQLNKADTLDQLADAASLIGSVADETQRKELTAIYERRGTEIKS